MIREPAVAGQFYEGDEKRLREQIKKCFLHKLGPKKLPGKQGKKRLIAAVVPHAGYTYSGPCAANVYKEIAESGPIETFVILGPNHNGVGSSVAIYPEGEWKTPLGNVGVDKDLAEAVLKTAKIASADTTAHAHEHSIEVQLPFLQFIAKDFKILPVCIKGIRVLEEANDLVGAILNAAYKLNRKIMVIASSDLTHYGPSYMYIPFKGNAKQVNKKVVEMDKKAIAAIEKLKEVEFLKHIVKNNATICGYAPITAAMIYARSMKVKSGKLLRFYTSAEISKDYNNTVSYAGITFS
jgi:AmmeMemoRadiSam system protein B